MKYVGGVTTFVVAIWALVFVLVWTMGTPDSRYVSGHPSYVRGVWRCYAEVTVHMWPLPIHRTLSARWDDSSLCGPKP